MFSVLIPVILFLVSPYKDITQTTYDETSVFLF